MPELQPYSSANRLMDEIPPEMELPMKQSQAWNAIRQGAAGGQNNARTGILIALIITLWCCGFAAAIGIPLVSEEFRILPSELPFIGDLTGAMICLTMPLLFVGTILLIFGFNFVWNMMVGKKLGVPSVNASDVKVRGGDTLDIDFAQMANEAVDVQGIDFRFYLQEQVVYTSGTDRITKTEEFTIAEESRPGRAMQSGFSISERFNCDIPADAMHTFYHSNNKLQWFVAIRVKLARWPDFNGLYEIIVLPERGTSA